MFDDLDPSGLLRWRGFVLGALKVFKGMKEQEGFLATMEEFGVAFEKLPRKLRWRIFDLVEREAAYRKGSYETSTKPNTQEEILQVCLLRAAAVSSLCLKGEVVYENRRRLLVIDASSSNEIIEALLDSITDVAEKRKEPTMDLCIYRSAIDVGLADSLLRKRLLQEIRKLNSPARARMEQLVEASTQ